MNPGLSRTLKKGWEIETCTSKPKHKLNLTDPSSTTKTVYMTVHMTMDSSGTQYYT